MSSDTAPETTAPETIAPDTSAADESAADVAVPFSGDKPPPPAPPTRGLGVVGWLRWGWRQLTSMRTALVLLFLVAVASIPGSLFPQRGVNQARVLQYFEDNPELAAVLDRLWLFDVFTAPWFAAVYLLLFISLVGCVVPRAWHHFRAMRQPPPPAPRRLERLPSARILIAPTEAPAEAPTDAQRPGTDAVDEAERFLRARRFRVRRGEDGSLAAEKGFLRETGNLVFHLSLVVMLIGVAVGSVFGFRGNVLVREGAGFSNTLTQYDSFRPGRLFQPEQLQPFSFTLDDFVVDFEPSGEQRGAPREFFADLTYRVGPGEPEQQQRIAVNSPLVLDGGKVFLIGWGYAPRFTVTDGEGNVVLDGAVPFLPQDGNFSSTGVVKAPDALPEQLGLQGIFLPTTTVDEERGPISIFPAAVAPSVFLSAWTGDLGLDDGIAQSIYTLDTENMERIGIEALAPGDRWVLPDGAGEVTFEGVEQFATFSVASDPGGPIALAASVAAVIGLVMSLFIRRRRLWVRTSTDATGRTVVTVAGLARTENGDPGVDLDELVEALSAFAVPEEEALPKETVSAAAVPGSEPAARAAGSSGAATSVPASAGVIGDDRDQEAT